MIVLCMKKSTEHIDGKLCCLTYISIKHTDGWLCCVWTNLQNIQMGNCVGVCIDMCTKYTDGQLCWCMNKSEKHTVGKLCWCVNKSTNHIDWKLCWLTVYTNLQMDN